ncbi:hypothetical protein CEUSTIGMA_g11124.t1 [Chlamydomonas eustigma]|uniref:RNA polymerase II-associated protein 3 n=1 Tax=Chlamydomonas eustigma TaxID=1157962 RepID=A0A250XL98_9CHLO|nr:hypothetical protein CEUSTIGMA_g11124.t1 [Chlamydomonas eustigma]|eukprot:GAX83699.1 hypothetical protein CEUSTIGMA_g11124.t1 [Chlamydomonas eustigma]
MMLEAETERVLRIGNFTISEKERVEFDNITGEQISQITDCEKLRRLEAYMAHEGLAPTAEAARQRLNALGSVDPILNPHSAHEHMAALKASKADLKSWTASMSSKTSSKSSSTPSSISHSPAAFSTMPPVRAVGTIQVKPGVLAATAATSQASNNKPTNTKHGDPSESAKKKDSKFGGNVRSGTEYYQAWDKFADKALEDSDDDEQPSKPAAPAAVPKPKQEAAAATSEAGPIPARGPALTERLIAVNQGLTNEEKEYNANAEKIKGNECFKSKEYAQAVERYTISLGFVPTAPAVHANRAAAYIKLRMWDAAVADCDMALTQDPCHVKARVRRAAARLELSQPDKAMEDIEAALLMDPSNSELLNMKERTDKLLSKSTIRRIVIDEEDDDEEDGNTALLPSPSTNKPQASASLSQEAAGKPRTRITVVEESDESGEDGEEQEENKQASPTSPLPATCRGGAPSAVAAFNVAASAPGSSNQEPLGGSRKVRIAVVDDDDSDEGESVGQPSGVKPGVTIQGSPPPPPPPPPASLERADNSSTAAVPVPASPHVSAPYQPTESPSQRASKIKDLGNRFFAKGDFASAIKSYKEALELDKANAVLYANLALGKLKAGDLKGSLSDASVSVSLDPSYHKAMHRRALAKKGLGLLHAARDDLKIAIDMVGPGHDSKASLEADMRAVIKDMVEAEKKKKAQQAASAAASKKHHYKGGVTIEVHEDEDEEDHGAKITAAQLKKVEDDAAALAMRLKRESASAQHEWEEQEAQSLKAWQEAQKKVVVDASKGHQMAGRSDQQAASTKSAPNLSPKPAPTVVAVALGSGNTSEDLAAEAGVPSPPTPPPAVAPGSSKGDADLEEVRQQGNKMYSLGDMHGALMAYEQCLYKDPSSVPVHANMALTKLRLGDSAGAISHCDVVLQTSSADPSTKLKAQHRKAQALAALGRLEEALEAYKPVKAALKVHPQVEKEYSEIVQRLTAQEDLKLKTRLAEEENANSAAREAARKAEELAAQIARSKAEAEKAAEEQRALQVAAEAAAKEVHRAKEEARAAEEKAAAQRKAVDEAVEKVQSDATSTKQLEIAEQERQLGNSHFGKGSYEEAVGAYTRSIGAKPSAASFSNRALVMLKLNRPIEAEADCKSALALDPGLLKAHHRWALSLKDQGRLEAAVAKMDEILSSEELKAPREITMQLELERSAMKQQLSESGSAKRGSTESMTSERNMTVGVPPEVVGGGREVQIPAAKRTTIKIEESNSSDEEDEEASSPSLPLPAAALMAQAAAADASGAGSGGNTTSVPGGTVSATLMNKATTPSASPDVAEHSSKPTPPSAPDASTASAQPTPPAVVAARLHEAASAKAAAAIDKLASKRPTLPRSAVEFERSCKLVSNNFEVLVDFVKSVKPSSYQAVFKEAISGQIIASIVHALKGCLAESPDFAELSLRKLSEVSRFSMAASMLSKAAKIEVGEVLSSLETAGRDVAELRSKYKV